MGPLQETEYGKCIASFQIRYIAALLSTAEITLAIINSNHLATKRSTLSHCENELIKIREKKVHKTV